MKIKKHITNIRHITISLFCCLQFSLAPAYPAYAAPDWPVPEKTINAQAGIVIDADSGAVLYEKDADTLYPPASTTKVLTALVVLENCQNLDDTITFSHEAMTRVEADSGNTYNIAEGDQMTVRDGLYFLILCSSNHTANALAEYVAGDIDSFVQMMNDKARSLGITDSHFDNPSGLNGDTQYVTARELALIAKAAYTNPVLLEISNGGPYKMPATISNPNGFSITSEHKLIATDDENSRFYFPAAKAGKTGFLKAAGNTLITYAEQDGRKLVSVVLKGSQGEEGGRYFIDSKDMLSFGFADFTNYKISEQEDSLFSETDIAVLEAKGVDVSEATVDEEAVITLPKGAAFGDAQKQMTTELPAGHPEDAVAAFIYSYNNQTVGTVYVNYVAKQPADTTLPEETTQPPETPDDRSAEPKQTSGMIPIIIAVLIIVAAGAVVALFLRSKRKERQQIEERRQKRRMRLEELGISQEEFEQLLENRKQKRNETDD